MEGVVYIFNTEDPKAHGYVRLALARPKRYVANAAKEINSFVYSL